MIQKYEKSFSQFRALYYDKMTGYFLLLEVIYRTTKGGSSLTYEQKRQIEALRLNNMSYGKIAKETGVSKDSVKSYCRRHGLKKEDLILYEKCLQCGTPLVQTAAEN